jgi:hypothetical protein
MLATALGRTRVRWLGGAILVETPGTTLLVEAPQAAVPLLRDAGVLPSIDAVVLSSDRTRHVSGLMGLAGALWQAGRRASLQVVHPLTAERPAVVASAWSGGWPQGPALQLDAAAPGSLVDLGPVVVHLLPLAMAEADLARQEARPIAGVGVRLETGDGVIAWLPSARPGSSARAVVHGAELAIIEVARAPFPHTDHPWRRDAQKARMLGASCAELWLVGDDGEPFVELAN